MSENFENFLNSPEMEQLRQAQEQASIEYEKNCDEYWDNLSYEDKLKAFYSVCKRIYKGDIKDKGSYRHVLYNVFGFDMDSYGIGMDCGYMAIHNSIYHESEKNGK